MSHHQKLSANMDDSSGTQLELNPGKRNTESLGNSEMQSLCLD